MKQGLRQTLNSHGESSSFETGDFSAIFIQVKRFYVCDLESVFVDIVQDISNCVPFRFGKDEEDRFVEPGVILKCRLEMILAHESLQFQSYRHHMQQLCVACCEYLTWCQ